MSSGIDAQRLAVAKYVPTKEFIEVESGKRKDRPELTKAIAYCQKTGATLIVAKLDRLARNVAFVSALMDSKVEFICADFPSANRLTIHILAAVAEHEASMISSRTKAGLAAAKAKGVRLGKSLDPDYIGKDGLPRNQTALAAQARTEIANQKAAKVAPTIAALQTGGLSLRQIAQHLNDMNVTTPRGSRWTAQAVKNALARA